METTVSRTAWKVGKPDGLFHEGRHYTFNEPIPRMEQSPNFSALRNLGWILPNLPEEYGEALLIAAHEKEEAATKREAAKPPAKRKKLGRKRGHPRKTEVQAEA